MNMTVTAADRGIGSGHSAVVREDLACRLLSNPDSTWCQSLITLGCPADRP
jgi:hypothetical protein